MINVQLFPDKAFYLAWNFKKYEVLGELERLSRGDVNSLLGHDLALLVILQVCLSGNTFTGNDLLRTINRRLTGQEWEHFNRDQWLQTLQQAVDTATAL